MTRALEQIGFFTGLGVVIVLLAATALGRFSVISVRDAKRAEAQAEAAAGPDEPVTTPSSAASTGGWRRYVTIRRDEPDDEALEPDAERVSSSRS